jgi:hypothetical protein
MHKSVRARTSIRALLLAIGTALLAPAMGQSAEHDRLAELVQSAGFQYSEKWWLKPAPDFSHPDVRTGEALSLGKDFAGKVVFIDLWASW